MEFVIHWPSFYMGFFSFLILIGLVVVAYVLTLFVSGLWNELSNY